MSLAEPAEADGPFGHSNGEACLPASGPMTGGTTSALHGGAQTHPLEIAHPAAHRTIGASGKTDDGSPDGLYNSNAGGSQAVEHSGAVANVQPPSVRMRSLRSAVTGASLTKATKTSYLSPQWLHDHRTGVRDPSAHSPSAAGPPGREHASGMAATAKKTLASSRTQLTVFNHGVSASQQAIQQVIQAAVVHQALNRSAVPPDRREPPPRNAARKKPQPLEGRYQREADKVRNAEFKNRAKSHAQDRIPTLLEVARFAEMCEPGDSLLTLLEASGTNTTDTETVFGGAEQDVRVAVQEAVRAITSSRRIDDKGGMLTSPINLRALLGLGGDDGGGSSTRRLNPPVMATEPEVRARASNRSGPPRRPRRSDTPRAAAGADLPQARPHRGAPLAHRWRRGSCLTRGTPRTGGRPRRRGRARSSRSGGHAERATSS